MILESESVEVGTGATPFLHDEVHDAKAGVFTIRMAETQQDIAAMLNETINTVLKQSWFSQLPFAFTPEDVAKWYLGKTDPEEAAMRKERMEEFQKRYQ